MRRISEDFLYQRTIEKQVKCKGIGLHSGEEVEVVLHPAPVDYGIRFKIVLEGKETTIGLSPFLVFNTEYATCIGYNGVKLCTVEHILAVIRGLLIDNLLIEVHGSEIPIMDGSGICFVNLLREAKIIKQPAYKRFYKIKRSFCYRDGERWIKAYPYKGLKIKYTISYPHPCIKTQKFLYKHGEENFIKEISKARTFGFLSEVEKLKQKNLIKGGSLDNALVFDDKGVVNKEGLRFKDEPVRHKILDFIGDINLLEYPILGFFDVFCSGHRLNNLFLKKLYENKEELLTCIDFNEKRYKILTERFKHPILA